jgi:alpha-L-fucosidase
MLSIPNVPRFALCVLLALPATVGFAAQTPATSQPAPVPAKIDPATLLPAESGPFQPTMQSFKAYKCPEWFRDAKFGIWAHWGPDSVPGLFNNYAHDMWTQGSAEYKWHLQHFGHPSKVGYEAVIESWKAQKWDPDALMAKYKAAGAKYFVALATHHDNFDCFDSTYHEWNSVNHGPHKDIVGLWRAAALKAGLRFGVSSHADERGWNYMYGAQLADKTGPLAGVPYVGTNPLFASLYNHPLGPKDKPPESWKEEWLKRHVDLVDKYHPDLLYFDGGIPHGPYGMALIAHYLNENAKAHDGQVEAVVNIKAGNFVPDKERGLATTIQDKPWQAETSLSGWFYMNYNPHNDPASLVKDAPTIIDSLIDVVSKNGCYLVNFPQRGDGSLYPECERVLDELAKWMPINGEGIFDSRPWKVFGEGPTVLKTGGMNELHAPLTWQDIRYTAKGNVLYAFCCGLPQGPVKMTSLSGEADKINNISLLGSAAAIQWKATPEGLVIQPSAAWPCAHAICYKITWK